MFSMIDTVSVTPVHEAMLGLPEMLVILAIVVVLFGATKLPQLGKGMGEAIGNFKKAQRAANEDANDEVDATPQLEAQAEDAVQSSFEKKSTHA